jgi:predicted RNA-binding protein with RPS1 domain
MAEKVERCLANVPKYLNIVKKGEQIAVQIINVEWNGMISTSHRSPLI